MNTSSLLTTREMFYIVGTRGFDTNYHRIPIIETNPPSIVTSSFSSHPQEALSEIADILVNNSNSKSIVFTDMSGHNKSTYCSAVAMVIRVTFSH